MRSLAIPQGPAHETCGRPSLVLRSGSGLEVPRSNKKYGDHGFSVCAPALWNTLS